MSKVVLWVCCNYDENQEESGDEQVAMLPWKEPNLQDHCLKELCTFSLKRNAMIAISDEGLYARNDDGQKIDRRIKISFSNIKFCKYSYFSLCQVTSRLRNGRKVAGTGFFVNSKGIYLTSATNFITASSRTKRLLMFSDTRLYVRRQGEEMYDDCIYLDDNRKRVHPKFNGKPSCGFDILKLTAINVTDSIYREFTLSFPKSLDWDVLLTKPRLDDIKKGMSVEVAGYPGESGGHPYTHTGKVIDITDTPDGGRLLWYDADTTPGNSGSCIMITDMDYVRSCTVDPETKKIVVGIHSGHDEVEQLNYGTLITYSIYKWIIH